MVVENKQTGVQYTMPKESWEKLGAHQKKFKIIDAKDGVEQKDQIIDNKAKPDTGGAKKNNTQTTTITPKKEKK